MIHCDTLLQNATDIIRKCDNYFVRKCDRSLLQNASDFLLQNATVITNCDSTWFHPSAQFHAIENSCHHSIPWTEKSHMKVKTFVMKFFSEC